MAVPVVGPAYVEGGLQGLALSIGSEVGCFHRMKMGSFCLSCSDPMQGLPGCCQQMWRCSGCFGSDGPEQGPLDSTGFVGSAS